MSYAVITIKKQKGNAGGLSADIERKIWNPIKNKYVTYTPNNADATRTKLNKEYIKPEGISRAQAIENRIKDAKVIRGIRTDAIKCLNIVTTSDHEKMMEIERSGHLDEWAHDCIQFCQEQFGKENVVAATLHMDQKTPHLHIAVVPIVQGQAKKQIKSGETADTKKRRYKKQIVTARLSSKEVLTRIKLKIIQAEFAKLMTKYGMERGIEGTQKHKITIYDTNNTEKCSLYYNKKDENKIIEFFNEILHNTNNNKYDYEITSKIND